jgi:multicomponent K+:H+ antiporter subunit D
VSFAWSHLIVVPVVLPLLAAAVLLVVGETRRRFKAHVNIIATLAGLVAASTLLWKVDRGGGIAVYLAGNWEAPFGIVLVADRLAALMLVLVGVVGLAVALYAEAAWARAGVYFHPLFQIQLMGLNGAFLTGDFFNLFVFFEVMLAASYGLQLHGSGWPRVRSGLHYIAVNLLASSLFLVGIAVIYGVMGTLTMADVAAKVALVPVSERGLLHAGAAVLAMAFLIKAAVWPLNSWLVPAYTAASAPVAALFALMTKVGIYALLRSWTLLFSADAGPSLRFGAPVLLYGGFATIAFGTLGLMASRRLGRIASFSILVSSGTLLAALGLGAAPVTSAALYYVLSATLAVSALFLLVELIDRIGISGRELPDVDESPGEDTNLDDQELPLVGRVFPMSITVLGLSFLVCAVLVAGLPPLSGFIAKFSLLGAVMRVEGAPAGRAGLSYAGWGMIALLLGSGLAATVSLARAGIRHFWSMGSRFTSQLKGFEAVAVLSLLVSCFLLTVWAEPIMRYTSAAAAGLHAPGAYVRAVQASKARPGPTARERAGESTP